MKKIIIFVFGFLLLGLSFSFADVWVNGYFRKDGTYVQGHYRTNPNGIKWDNYSYNPTTVDIPDFSVYSHSYNTTPSYNYMVKRDCTALSHNLNVQMRMGAGSSSAGIEGYNRAIADCKAHNAEVDRLQGQRLESERSAEKFRKARSEFNKGFYYIKDKNFYTITVEDHENAIKHFEMSYNYLDSGPLKQKVGYFIDNFKILFKSFLLVKSTDTYAVNDIKNTLMYLKKAKNFMKSNTDEYIQATEWVEKFEKQQEVIEKEEKKNNIMKSLITYYEKALEYQKKGDTSKCGDYLDRFIENDLAKEHYKYDEVQNKLKELNHEKRNKNLERLYESAKKYFEKNQPYKVKKYAKRFLNEGNSEKHPKYNEIKNMLEKIENGNTDTENTKNISQNIETFTKQELKEKLGDKAKILDMVFLKIKKSNKLEKLKAIIPMLKKHIKQEVQYMGKYLELLIKQ